MKVIIIVLDSFGIGGAPDASKYNDFGSDTYFAVRQNGIKIPNLVKLGLNNIYGLSSSGAVLATRKPLGSFGRLVEKSCGKDTITGHFEIAGLVTKVPYPTYPNGFDESIIDKLEKVWGRKIIGNKAASGTEIINELGDLHVATGSPIVYTSADSVMQIACSEKLFTTAQLYEMCEQAREIMSGANNVGRIIARPFDKNEEGIYYRTENRKDFSAPPFGKTLLDDLKDSGKEVVAVGKITDIFSGHGITRSIDAHGNSAIMKATLSAIEEDFEGLIFSNFVDFDMLYGHRNDAVGYAKCLEEFDLDVPKLLNNTQDDDVIIITADHGCDPSTPSTDHSRETVPLIIYSKKLPSKNLGTIKGFDYIAKLVRALFKIS